MTWHRDVSEIGFHEEQRVRVTEDVLLESGHVLRAGVAATVFPVVDDALGIEWHDGEGAHAMAISPTKVEPLP